ncbi:MAG: polymer-forming cytoskeletal protein [Rhodospirillales bacterium]|nr:polymer-forming cytoskeletal protein [Rhodospirillales bacterium]
MAASSIFSTPKKPAYPAVDITGSGQDSISSPAPLMRSEYQGQASIGEGVHVKGDIHDCRQVDVHGLMEGQIETDILIIHEKGSVKGIIKAERAEIHGTADGEVTISARLDIRATGLVAGVVNYGELSVEAGGRVTGQLDHFSEKSAERHTPIPMDISSNSKNT